jgi:hypothetical protein
VHIPETLRHKLEDRAYQGYFVGYTRDGKDYLVYLPQLKRTIKSPHVDFAEHGTHDVPTSVKIPLGQPSWSSPPSDFVPATPDEHPLPSSRRLDGVDLSNIVEGSRTRIPKPMGDFIAHTVFVASAIVDDVPDPLDTDLFETEVGQFAVTDLPIDPKTYAQAMASPRSAEWQIALNKEIASLEERKVFEIVEEQAWMKPLRSSIVFKTKRDAQGLPIGEKARIVADGSRQREGIDYQETFSPVAKATSLRAFLTSAAINDHEIVQIDVKTAYLYGSLDEEVYMRPPPGWHIPRGLVLKLLKSLYGLKQSGNEMSMLTPFS